MRLVHVVTTLDPSGGGPPHVAIRLAAAQAALGHDVHLVSYAFRAQEASVTAQMAGVPGRERVHLHPLVDPAPWERLSGGRARKLLGDLMPGVDFVHIHGLWGSLLATAAGVARAAGVPYCFRPAGMLDPWSLRQKRWKKTLALATRYRALLNGAAFLHTLNEDEQTLIQPLRLRSPAIVIPNGIFLAEVQPLPARGTFRGMHPELGDAPLVLFLSRLHPKKGLDVLAEAFARLASRHPAARLVVAGPDDGARAEFQARVTAAGLASRVHLVGPLYGPQKLAALVDATCFCLPSRQEGLSVAILEAMASGLPVVISAACHFPEVAQAKAGVVLPLDAGAFAEALERIIRAPAHAAELGAAGRALVRDRYTWEATASACLEAYHRHRPGAT